MHFLPRIFRKEPQAKFVEIAKEVEPLTGGGRNGKQLEANEYDIEVEPYGYRWYRLTGERSADDLE